MKSKKQHLNKKHEEEVRDASIIERSGTAFDPNIQSLDLSKEEKRRTTALMMAIQGYRELIIKDADYLIAASDLARRNEGPIIRPATMDAMVDAAIKFDDFIAGIRPIMTIPNPSEIESKPTTAEA